MIDVGRPGVFHVVVWLAGALLVVLGALCWRLAKQAEIDHAERILRDEYRRDDDPGRDERG